MRRGASSSTRRTALRREAGPRRVDDHDVGRRQPALQQRAHGLGDVAGDEGRRSRRRWRLRSRPRARTPPRRSRRRSRARPGAPARARSSRCRSRGPTRPPRRSAPPPRAPARRGARTSRCWSAGTRPPRPAGAARAAPRRTSRGRRRSVVGRPVVTSASRSDSACSRPTHSGTASASSSTSWWRRRSSPFAVTRTSRSSPVRSARGRRGCAGSPRACAGRTARGRTRGPRLDRAARAVDRRRRPAGRPPAAAPGPSGRRGGSRAPCPSGPRREGELDLVAVVEDGDRGLDRGRARSRSGGRCAPARRAPATSCAELRLVGEVLPAAAAARRRSAGRGPSTRSGPFSRVSTVTASP